MPMAIVAIYNCSESGAISKSIAISILTLNHSNFVRLLLTLHQMRRGTLDIFQTVRVILARNLEIDPDAIYLDFQFQNFIDRLAQNRQQQSGSKDLLDYLEAANIYIDLCEAFDLSFLMDFTDKSCVTVADLILLIKAKLDSRVV
jgi:acyl carrier protein